MKRVAIVYGKRRGRYGRDCDARPLHREASKRARPYRPLPAEAFVVPRAIVQARKLGKVFSSGNGGDYAYAPIDPGFVSNVRSGAEELVSPSDPVKLGYLTAWAADYLASGHTFAPGPYNVGGPVGTVTYYSANQELRLGQLLTITKDNIDQYTGG